MKSKSKVGKVDGVVIGAIKILCNYRLSDGEGKGNAISIIALSMVTCIVTITMPHPSRTAGEASEMTKLFLILNCVPYQGLRAKKKPLIP